jgi:hypothetical protein
LMDVNNDQHPDLILGAMDSTQHSIVLLGNAQGDFTQQAPIVLPMGLYGGGQMTYDSATNTYSSTGTITLQMIPVDLNSDGFTDLVSVQTQRNPLNSGVYFGGSLQILENDGGTGFRDMTASWFPGLGPSLGVPAADKTYFYSVTADDLYQTGHPDLVVSVTGAGVSYSTIILINDGNGHFAKGGPVGLNYDSLLIPLHQPSGELDWASISYSIYGNTGPLPGNLGPYGLFNEVVSLSRDNKVGSYFHSDSYVGFVGKPIVVTADDGVLANDAGASFVSSLVQAPAHGSLDFLSDGSFTYRPAAGFAGIDGFTYTASNGTALGDGHALLYVVPVNGVGSTSTLALFGLSAEQQIAATYTAFFSRGADSAGFKFWVDLFHQYLPSLGPVTLFSNISSSFGVSDEAKGIYPFLAHPQGASDAQISSFLDTVYHNMFNRGGDTAGLAYWTGQIKQTLAAGKFVGDVLVNIISGTQNNADGQDITTLMSKVAVGLEYVHQQQQLGTPWSFGQDGASSTALLHAVTNDPQTVLVGIKQADLLVLADVH